MNTKNFINLIKQITKKPKKVLADRYTGIKSKEFIHYLEKQQIDYTYTMSDCPQSNSLVKRVNQTLINRLRCKRNEGNEKANWTKLMDQVVKEYNNSLHSVTEFSTNYLLFEIKPCEPPLIDPFPEIETARKIAQTNTIKHHEQTKKYYDERHQPYQFKENDLVYVKRGSDKNRKKLNPIRSGPHKILKKLLDTSYVIDLDNKKEVVHIAKIFPYQPP